MKKQYDVTKLTDELSKSVFFQEPKQTGRESKQAALSTKHQVTKALKIQSDKAPNNQPTKDTKQESTKEPDNQSIKELSKQRDKAPKQQSIMALKHFSSYLAPGTYKAWKLLATEREKKDYEILQEAVEQYLARQGGKH